MRFYHGAFAEIAREAGKSADLIETLFWRHNNAVCKGQMSLEELNSIFAKELDLESFDWKNYYLKNIEVMPGVKELLTWAAEHFEVGLLSDSMPGFIDELMARKVIPDLNYKVIIDSSKIGILKSEPAMYVKAQELAAVDPKEILLVDDSRANLIQADNAGWHVLWFNDFEADQSIQRVRESLEF